MPHRPQIVVVGAGIGGLTAALALSQSGFTVRVVERAAQFAPIGAGIQLSPNATRLLGELGLGSALRRAGARPDCIAIRSGRRGEVISRIPLGDSVEARYGAPYLVLHRAALHDLLRQALLGSAEIAMDTVVTGLDGAGPPASLRLRRGTLERTVDADIVVAADGLNSLLRGAVRSRGEPRFSGKIAWRAMMPLTDAPADLRRNETGLWLSARAHVVHYRVDDERLNIVVVTPGEALPGWTTSGDPEELMARLGGSPPLLLELLSGAKAWQCWSLADGAPARPWRRGGMVLLGDAAHPALPFAAQGGAMAIEDAYVLAEELVASPADMRGALGRYEARRARRTARIQKAARRQGVIFHLPQPLAWFRDAALRLAPPSRLLARQDGIYGWRPEHDRRESTHT